MKILSMFRIGVGGGTLLAFSSIAQANVTVTSALETQLNAIKDVTSTAGAERQKHCETLMSSMQQATLLASSSPNLKATLNQGQSVLQNFCTSPSDSEVYHSPAEAFDDPPSSPVPPEAEKPVTENPEIPQALWEADPRCTNGDRNIYNCSFNHKRGRGLFIYKEPGRESFPQYLVCALAAGQNSSPFGSGYAITSRCLVSSLDWRGYVFLDPEIRKRSDVQGFLTWSNQSGVMRPIRMPQVMSEQCNTAFSEAIFCTPTLMVLPTQSSTQVDVCGLHSHRSSFSLLFISIRSASSRWKCERMDIRQTVDDGVLSVNEERCVPDFSGRIDPSCDLPYIPRTQNNIRVRRDD